MPPVTNEAEAIAKALELVASAYGALLLLQGREAPETSPLSAMSREELIREAIHCTGFAQTLIAKHVDGAHAAIRKQMDAYRAELDRRRSP
jgi:hypothetical protein